MQLLQGFVSRCQQIYGRHVSATCLARVRPSAVVVAVLSRCGVTNVTPSSLAPACPSLAPFLPRLVLLQLLAVFLGQHRLDGVLIFLITRATSVERRLAKGRMQLVPNWRLSFPFARAFVPPRPCVSSALYCSPFALPLFFFYFYAH